MRDVILEDCLLVQKELLDCSDFDAQQQHLEEEMRIAADLVRYCIEENALKVQDQAEYLMRYDQFTQRYEKLKKKYDALEAERQRRKENHDRLGAFIATMEQIKTVPVNFDADRIDAVGAVGIARTFAYGGAKGRSLADSLTHFDEKLLLLYDLLNTEEAKRIAKPRYEFLKEFYARFQEETK